MMVSICKVAVNIFYEESWLNPDDRRGSVSGTTGLVGEKWFDVDIIDYVVCKSAYNVAMPPEGMKTEQHPKISYWL